MCETLEQISNRLEQAEHCNLSSYALFSSDRGRLREYKNTAPLEVRTEYHRDRDRIVWARSFKRMQHKTQVFPHYVEDHYRRRLTHSLEVAQIATTLARALELNEVATEAIALGHDLGHAPFGHAGEETLNRLLVDYGRSTSAVQQQIPIFGFDHCVHGVEVVSRIETEYVPSGHPGLNLTFDVRDGILKHMFDRTDLDPVKNPFGTIKTLLEQVKCYQSFGENKGSLEAQCVYFADKIAYLFGDIEDGLRSGIFDYESLNSSDFLKTLGQLLNEYKRSDSLTFSNFDGFLQFRRNGLAAMILDCITTSRKEIDRFDFHSVSDILSCGHRVVHVSPEIHSEWTAFHKQQMVGRLYVHHDVAAAEYKASKIAEELFGAYFQKPDLISREYRSHMQEAYRNLVDTKELLKLVTVTNYVAGMTDSFAINQHSRLFNSAERLVF